MVLRSERSSNWYRERNSPFLLKVYLLFVCRVSIYQFNNVIRTKIVFYWNIIKSRNVRENVNYLIFIKLRWGVWSSNDDELQTDRLTDWSLTVLYLLLIMILIIMISSPPPSSICSKMVTVKLCPSVLNLLAPLLDLSPALSTAEERERCWSQVQSLLARHWLQSNIARPPDTIVREGTTEREEGGREGVLIKELFH